MISRDQYTELTGRSQRSSVRLAIAAALAEHLRGLTFQDPDGGAFRFAEVFEEWPSWEDEYVGPAAVVLPSNGVYSDAYMSPNLMADTWAPEHQEGLGLYALSEFETTLNLLIRTPTTGMRDAILSSLETAFVDEGVLMNFFAGPRYGIVRPMPDYWNLPARFTLLEHQSMDDEDRALHEFREETIVIGAQAPHVRLDVVYPMNVQFRLGD